MRYCPKCKKHTEHTIAQAKRKERGTLKKGSIERSTRRGHGLKGFGNKGKYSRKAITAWKMVGAKSSKKQDLTYRCKDCSKTWTQRKGFRAKK